MGFPVFLLMFCCCFAGMFANAQQLVFSGLGDQVQLPAQECYNIMQDSRGYIWFSTERGLCRYANNRLTVFDRRNGLPEESVYAVDEDPSGTLWFMTSENRILQYANGQLKEAAFNSAYRKPQVAFGVNLMPFFIDAVTDGPIYSSNRYYTTESSSQTNTVKRIDLYSDANFVFLKKHGRRLVPFPKLGINGKGEVRVEIVTDEGNYTVKIPNTVISSLVYFQSQTCMVKNTDFFSLHDRLVRVNADRSISAYVFPDRIVSLYADKTNGLWVGTLKNGLYYYPDISTMKLGQHSLEGYSVTGICEDNEQGIWCSTLEKGIFYSRSKFITSYTAIPGLDKRSTLLSQAGGIVFSSSTGNTLFSFEDGIPAAHELALDESFVHSDIIRFQNSWIMGGILASSRLDDAFRLQQLLMVEADRKHYVACYRLAQTKGGKLYSVMHKMCYELDPGGIKHIYELPLTGKYISALTDDQLFIGAREGLYLLNTQTGKTTKTAGLKGNVTAIVQSRSGTIWVATKTDGIYWFDRSSGRCVPIPFSLETPVFFDLTEDAYGRIWAASAIGLMCFQPDGKSHHVQVFNTLSGLPSNEVYKVISDRQTLYFSTFEGLFSFPLKSQPVNAVHAPVYLHELQINGRPVKITAGKIHVGHRDNSFRFLFDVLTFKSGTEAQLICEIDGPDGTSRNTITGNEWMLEKLAPGNYRIKVWALNNDGVKSLHPFTCTFEIERPWWLAWWFIAAMLLALALIVLLIVRFITGRIRKREEAKTAINKLVAEYQMTALQAQMNPHFIFNAINTIQGYILRKNENDAYSYLAKFSKLIRMVLSNSQHSTLLLHEELKMIHLYIELEQLRFDQCFDYELQLGEELDEHDMYLPGMLLQPYVENAIWHGIINLENSRRGKLVIGFSREDETLVITITDNGVGRELAKSFRKDINHQSMAMDLTEKRLMAINRLVNIEQAQVTVTDLYDEQGEASGTLVEIRLPIIQHYE